MRTDERPARGVFDAHRWFERYVAEHPVSDAARALRGVPFN